MAPEQGFYDCVPEFTGRLAWVPGVTFAGSGTRFGTRTAPLLRHSIGRLAPRSVDRYREFRDLLYRTCKVIAAAGVAIATVIGQRR
jgi:hypothetical protein